MRRLQDEGRAEVRLVVELGTREGITATLKRTYGDVTVMLTGPFHGHAMSPLTAARLRDALREERIDAVVVATEPLVHLSYLEALIPTGVHILVDKPIVAFEGVSTSSTQARRVLSEFERLTKMIAPDQVVAVALQRSHHAGFDVVADVVAEAAAAFGCPITFIGGSHGDGQFRSPHEIDSLPYHGTLQGYGKLFHSGMHIVAVQARLIAQAAREAGTAYESFSTAAYSVRPAADSAGIACGSARSERHQPEGDRHCKEETQCS